MKHTLARWATIVFLVVGLSACTDPGALPPVQSSAPVATAGPAIDAPHSGFASVVQRMQPVVEAECARRAPDLNCNFLVAVDRNPAAPINAYYTMHSSGRPLIVLTQALVDDARNDDELAFVFGHEAGHHIARHIQRSRRSALLGAVVAGTLAAAGGAGPGAIRSAQELGASVGWRTYSKDFELEADRLGTVLAWRTGYDPLRGAGFFNRLPDPGNVFLGSHPPNAERLRVINRTVTELRAGAPL